jgi:hypothetical protein
MNFPIFRVECKAPVDGMSTCSHYDDREARLGRGSVAYCLRVPSDIVRSR